MFKLKSLLIEKPNKYSLIIRKSRLKLLFSIVQCCLYFLFSYGIVFYYILPIFSIYSLHDLLDKIQQFLDKNPQARDEPWLIVFFLFVVLPIFNLPKFIGEIWAFFHVDTFYFDSLSKNITINKNLQIRFDEIDKLRIRRFPRSKNINEYSLSIITRDQKKIKIGQSSNFEDICDGADEIADLIGLSIVDNNCLKADAEDWEDWEETNSSKNDDW